MSKRSIDKLFRILITMGVLLSLLGSPAVGNNQIVHASENRAPLLTDMGTLIEEAQGEGYLTVIALPENWCNYGALIDGFEYKYTIDVISVLPDGSSAEELQAIRDGGPDAPDVIDVGVSFAQIAKDEGLITPYQVATWDTIPDFMKDSEGYWYGDYYGVMSIATNTSFSSSPNTWEDLQIGGTVGPVALGGDPIFSNKAFFGVYAAALGNGGTLDDIEPGISFFRDLNAAERFLPDGGGEDSLVSGETPVLLEWSYNALTFRDAHPESSIEVVIPGPSPIASYYAQAVSAYAPHPNAARLWMEYLYSDEGQLAFLEGYCFPARYDGLLNGGVIPEDMLERLPDLEGAVFPNLDQIEVAKDVVDHKWTCTVYGNCPWMRVNHVSDQLDAWNWPYPGHLDISIEKLEGEDLYMDMDVSPGEEGNPSTWFDLGEYDIEVGDEITLTDGYITKAMRVIDLTIDSVDIESDIVTGRVEPFLEIRLPCPSDSETYVADEDGNGFWEVNLMTGCGFDLVPGAVVIAEVYDEDGDLTTVEWNIPNPHFTIFPEAEWFDGLDWPDESNVTITVEGKPECEILDVPGGGFFNGGFPEGCDIEAGDNVTFSDGDTVREHQVRNLYITDVDISENTVTGISDAAETVFVSAHDGGFEPLIVTAAESGVWQVDLLAEAGYIISDNSEGRSEIRDEMGNATASDWHVTHPHFTVFPEWEWFDGLDWPNGAIVEITVTGKDECATEKESWGYFFNGNFGEGCNIEFGDEITFTDGTTTRTHNVRNLYVTDVNVADNTVSGKADGSEGNFVYVWPHDPSFVPLETSVDEFGNWEVNLFAEAGYTIDDDTEGRSEIRDEMGNATASDWHVTHPHFTVFPEWEWFDGLDWPNGAIVEITVSGKDECATEKESWGYFFNGNFGEGCDLEIGDTVTFSDGKTSQEHIVQNLTVTKANQDDNTIKGTALPGAEVFVWSHATGEEQLAIAKKTGKWLVDFNDFYDLVPGECGRSEVRVNIDDSGYYNSTAVDWCISNPRIVASESGDWFWTTDFKPGDLNISIFDTPDEGANLLWSGEQVADESGFIVVGPDIHGLDLQPGNLLVVSDDDIQKSLILQPITMTMLNIFNDSMAGYAPMGADVWAAAGPQEWQERIMVQADPTTGYWFADFASIGFDITVDMQPWSCFAQIFDEDGDANESPPPPAILWQDDFEDSMLDEWEWVNENPENWEFVDGSSLRINTSTDRTGFENLLLLPVADGDFTIETQLTFTPTRNYQIAGLVIWQDADHYLQFGRAFCSQEWCVDEGVYFDYVGGESSENFALHDESGEIYLRLVRDGENIHALDSIDGETWNYIGTHTLIGGFQVNAVGLTSAQDFYKEVTDEWTPAEFEYFQLSESDPPPY
jgi:putative spermidine/putrescine transport system substrate-binding protein